MSEQNRIVTCTVVRGEVLFGIERLQLGRRRSELEIAASGVLKTLNCESIPPSAAGVLCCHQMCAGSAGGCHWMRTIWIAATALALRATPVTRDSDFNGIDGLNVVAFG